VLRTVGPGVIGLGVAIGSGEWLLGPSVIVKHGAALLWITTAAVVLQVILNQEMARYTMYTGEPIITGYMRTRPGPRVWGWTYGLLSFLQYGWPGWALASATAGAALVLGRIPADADARLVIALGYATFAFCFVLAVMGKKVERTIEMAMWVMTAWIIAYLLAVDVALASSRSWATALTGFVRGGAVPEGADWLLLGAFAAYSGLGGIGHAYLTNWYRDKGFGMGATVGYIPGALGSQTRLSPTGNAFPVDADALRSWRRWWRYLHVDQWVIFGLGSLGGMLLTAVLTLEFVPAGERLSGWAVAGMQAEGIARAHGTVLWYLTLLCGFWVLFSTQVGVVDGVSRAVTDILWSGSEGARRWARGDVRRVYYGVLVAFAVWGCVALNLAQPLTLIVIGANVAAVAFVIESVHTVLVNRTLLPRELRPPLWREGCVVLCALFYGSFVVANIAVRI
jgi:hypothetical protein